MHIGGYFCIGCLFAFLFSILFGRRLVAFSFCYSFTKVESWSRCFLFIDRRECWLDIEAISFDSSCSKFEIQIFKLMFLLNREIKEKIAVFVRSVIVSDFSP